MKVLQFPLTKITIAFISGILFSFYAKPNPELIFALVLLNFICFCIAFLVSKKKLKQGLFFGITTYFLAFFIGISTQVIHNGYYQKDNYIHQTSNNKDHNLEVVLREKLKNSKYNSRYVAVVTQIDNQKSSGKIIVNFDKNIPSEKLEIGSQLHIKGVIIKHKPIHNPDQFDYGSYLTNKSILAQMYVDSYNIQINSKPITYIWYYSDKLRNRILQNLKKTGFATKELNVVAALILGQQQDISQDIIQDYQYAGAIHVLSVSGLHVGYLLLFITFLLKPLPKNKFGSILKLSLIILTLWVFALLAGLSPSVVRSVTMFSFVAIGMHLKRRTNEFHTLLVSILIILLFQPSFILDVGFQLSYVALFFILWLQPLLSDVWEPKNKIAGYFWDIITVSFAAQIGALPLSIYYFHQFPGLFFITNLLILPGLGVIMALGVIVLILAAFDCIPLFLSKLLETSIFILNKIINWIASFESFIIKDIAFNWYLLISLYLLIIATIIWFKQPSFKRIIVVLLSIFIFQSAYFGTQWVNDKKKECIVFDVKKGTLIADRIGKQVTIYTNDSLKNNWVLKSYLVGNFCQIKKQKPIQNIAFFNSRKVIIIDSLAIFPKTLKPDILILRQSPKINLERIISFHKPKIIVADASNYKTYVTCWKSTCMKQKIPFHSTYEKGFYKIY